MSFIAACSALMGCATVTNVEVQRINIPVPVECREQVPARPVMPTEVLGPSATVDQYVQASTAEIERREGYEVQLVAALAICTRPITPVPGKDSLGLRGAWPK
ncbi:MAG: hypothetical protein EOO23_00320 [Comamonadaceae bacterium]|nr:MAG: hypothetical protein EOO23_00320 [Comamonadaceae bacterium]